jgi:hypothetical protein
VSQDALLEGSGSGGKQQWRGRAQQISLLKDKLRDAQRQLDSAATAVQEGGAPTVKLGERPESARQDRNRNRQEDQIAKMEKERRVELERLQAEVVQVNERAAMMKRKMESSTARCKTLEGTVGSLKKKLVLVLDKSTHDDKLIAEQRRHGVKLPPGGGADSEGAGAQRKRDGGGGARKGGYSAEMALKDSQIKRQEHIILALRDELRVQQGAGGGGTAQQQLEELALEAEKMAELNMSLRRQLEQREAGDGRCGRAEVAELRAQAEEDSKQFAALMEAKEEEVQLLQETLREQQYVYRDALAQIQPQLPVQQRQTHSLAEESSQRSPGNHGQTSLAQVTPQRRSAGDDDDMENLLQTNEQLRGQVHLSSPVSSPRNRTCRFSTNLSHVAQLDGLRSEMNSRGDEVESFQEGQDDAKEGARCMRAGSDPRGLHGSR